MTEIPDKLDKVLDWAGDHKLEVSIASLAISSAGLWAAISVRRHTTTHIDAADESKTAGGVSEPVESE